MKKKKLTSNKQTVIFIPQDQSLGDAIEELRLQYKNGDLDERIKNIQQQDEKKNQGDL